MRKWIKYSLDSSPHYHKEQIDSSFKDHSSSMGGYEVDEAYENEQKLFEKYFYNYNHGRIEAYFNFISKHVPHGKSIFSVGSGRCVLELFMKKAGYTNVTCSDLEMSDCHTAITLPFIPFNALTDAPNSRYDVVTCLSMIYLFDQNALKQFFNNIRNSLNPDGMLIVDSAGSEDSLLSYIIHDILLPLELLVKVTLMRIFLRKKHYIRKKEFGFRRTDQEITDAAKKAGFHLQQKENYCFLTEFRRLNTFNLLIKKKSTQEQFIERTIGQMIPYERIFLFTLEKGD